MTVSGGELGGVPRRPVVAAGGALAAAAVLGGCGGGGEDDSAAPAQSTSSSSTSSASGDTGGSSGDLVELSTVPVGGAVSAKAPDGKPIIVAQPSEGKAVAFSAKCTHKGCTVAPSGAKLQCPCHGSQFDALTGKVLRGPAQRPLSDFPVNVEGGTVVAR